jgi:hypothetical protein
MVPFCSRGPNQGIGHPAFRSVEKIGETSISIPSAIPIIPWLLGPASSETMGGFFHGPAEWFRIAAVTGGLPFIGRRNWEERYLRG